VVDARHMTEDGGLPTHASASRYKSAIRMAQYIEYGADLPPEHCRESLVQCHRKPKQKQCPGLMWVIKEADGRIVSLCLICRGTDMVISNWDETEWAEGMMPAEPTSMLFGPAPEEAQPIKKPSAGLPEFVAQQAERALAKYCDRRIPAHLRNEM